MSLGLIQDVKPDDRFTDGYIILKVDLMVRHGWLRYIKAYDSDVAFKDIYNPFVEKLSSQFNEKAWEKIEFSKMTDVKVSNFYECMD